MSNYKNGLIFRERLKTGKIENPPYSLQVRNNVIWMIASVN